MSNKNKKVYDKLDAGDKKNYNLSLDPIKNLKQGDFMGVRYSVPFKKSKKIKGAK